MGTRTDRPPTKSVDLRLGTDLLAAIDAEAALAGVSRAAWMRAALARAVAVAGVSREAFRHAENPEGR